MSIYIHIQVNINVIVDAQSIVKTTPLNPHVLVLRILRCHSSMGTSFEHGDGTVNDGPSLMLCLLQPP